MASRPGVDSIVPEKLHTSGLSVSIQGNSEIKVIRIRHLANNGKVLSEAMLLPEDAYNYARAVLDAYDEIEEIDVNE